MLAYTGIETISNMSEEARDEAKTIPAAINRVRIAVFAIYFTLPAVALSAPWSSSARTGRTTRCSGCPRRRAGSPATRSSASSSRSTSGRCRGPASSTSACSATILFLATNAGIIGVSRLVYSMGIHRQMPDGLRQLHPRFRTPWIGILVFSGLAIPILLPGQEAFLGSIYSFGALLSFTIAHAAVIRLRRKLPDFPRQYRGPGNLRIGGYDAPLFAIAGGSFTAIAFVVIAALNLTVAAFGVGWLLMGILAMPPIAVGRASTCVRPSRSLSEARRRPRGRVRLVLVPVLDGRYDEHVLATAIKLAARKRRGIHVVSLVTVPSALPLSAPMEEEEDRPSR